MNKKQGIIICSVCAVLSGINFIINLLNGDVFWTIASISLTAFAIYLIKEWRKQ